MWETVFFVKTLCLRPHALVETVVTILTPLLPFFLLCFPPASFPPSPLVLFTQEEPVINPESMQQASFEARPLGTAEDPKGELPCLVIVIVIVHAIFVVTVLVDLLV